MSPAKALETRGTATAPLLYWLAVICGLGGITILRANEPREFVPIWFGSVVGLALGQILAVLRLRIWIIGVVGFMLSWFFIPATICCLAFVFGGGTSGSLDDVLMTLVPAAICGYASLSERGGLLAFWFPTMLWMLVILDGAAPGTFSTNKSLPLVMGLGALFIGYLRARETRRTALWQAHGTVRLAQASPRLVLRASPLRGMGQLAWTGLIGAGTFLLAATIAPKMWQKDREVRHREELATLPTDFHLASSTPCCPDPNVDREREKIREYLPLHGHDDSSAMLDVTPCQSCRFQAAATDPIQGYGAGPGVGVRAMDEHWRPFRGEPPYGAYGYDSTGNLVWSTGGYASNDPSVGNNYNYNNYSYPTHYDYPTGTTYTPPVGTTYSYSTPTYVPPPAHYTPPTTFVPQPTHYTPPVVTHTPPPKPKPPVVVTKPKPPPVTPIAKTTPVAIARAAEGSTPWDWVLPFLLGMFAFPLVWRVVRRTATLRHLARPFWRESLDQRISNQWQRMLIGLRDAGIHLRTNEQPQAFAKRVGIAGMEACATILERVRHGVRVEVDDLETMEAATTTIYRTARSRAGVTGRVAGSFRWPLV